MTPRTPAPVAANWGPILASRITQEDQAASTITVATEPSFVALGPFCVACGMNNRVWFYSLGQPGGAADGPAAGGLINEREYFGTVKQVALSEAYAAVLVQGKIMLHPYDPTGAASGGKPVAAGREEKRFPEKADEKDVTAMAITPDFLIYGTSRGSLHYFYLKQWTDVNEFRHDCGIRQLFPNLLATRLVFIDDSRAA